MADPKPAVIFRTMIEVARSANPDLLLGCGSGALMAIFGDTLLQKMLNMALGFWIPLGPLYLYFTSDRQVERRLETLKRWKDAGLIPTAEYNKSGAALMAWQRKKRTGDRA